MTGGGGGGKACVFKCADGVSPRAREGHKPTWNGCGVPGFMVETQFGMTEVFLGGWVLHVCGGVCKCMPVFARSNTSNSVNHYSAVGVYVVCLCVLFFAICASAFVSVSVFPAPHPPRPSCPSSSSLASLLALRMCLSVFTKCCNAHDICYHTCKIGKEQKKGQDICDTQVQILRIHLLLA